MSHGTGSRLSRALVAGLAILGALTLQLPRAAQAPELTRAGTAAAPRRCALAGPASGR